jgi:oxygen-independent coproporphyrinogen-3 oxidase
MDLTLPQLPPLALYVHLPWCVRKCPYCDFNSHSMADATPLDRYVDAVLRDLDGEAELAGDREVISVFLGGGTPSVFSPAQISRLLDGIEERFVLDEDAEITMEANPGTVECGDPAGYRLAGVNRLSIGAQSFSPQALSALGRIHSVEDIGRAVREAQDAGFDNINIDLMYGLPEQDVAAAMDDIEQAAELGPQHLSWYQLTLEPNTIFHARPPAGLPGSDAAFEIQSQGVELLSKLGYEQYEISAYASDSRRCRHNLNYWSFGDYLAAGAGAHGKISDEVGIWRYSKPANPKQYMEMIEKGEVAAAPHPVPAPDRLFEFMLNALRLNEGFSESRFTARTGLPAELLRKRMTAAVEKGLMSESGGKFWRTTALGRRFLNDLQADFLPQ